MITEIIISIGIVYLFGYEVVYKVLKENGLFSKPSHKTGSEKTTTQ